MVLEEYVTRRNRSSQKKRASSSRKSKHNARGINTTRIKRKQVSKKAKLNRKTRASRIFLGARSRRLYIVVMMIALLFVASIIVASVRQLMDNGREPDDISSKNNFIMSIEGSAMRQYKQTGVLPSIIIAQAILESNWGESDLSTKGYNLFGIKADPSWHGKKIKFRTKENYDDVITAYFRKYDSWDDSIEDHGRFLTENKRYRRFGMFETKDYHAQAQALEDATYSTVRNSQGEKIYARTLVNLIDRYRLYEYDRRVLSGDYKN